jgi:hypothetical protein
LHAHHNAQHAHTQVHTRAPLDDGGKRVDLRRRHRRVVGERLGERGERHLQRGGELRQQAGAVGGAEALERRGVKALFWLF